MGFGTDFDTDFWVRDEQIHEKYELYEHMAFEADSWGVLPQR